MKPFSIHKVQINTQQIHSKSIQKKQPTMLKITSIHLKKNTITFFYKFSTDQIIEFLYIYFKELTPNTSSLDSKTKKKVL